MSAVPTPGVAGAASNVPTMRASSTSNLQPAADSAAPNGVAFQQGSRAAEAYVAAAVRTSDDRAAKRQHIAPTQGPFSPASTVSVLPAVPLAAAQQMVAGPLHHAQPARPPSHAPTIASMMLQRQPVPQQIPPPRAQQPMQPLRQLASIPSQPMPPTMQDARQSQSYMPLPAMPMATPSRIGAVYQTPMPPMPQQLPPSHMMAPQHGTPQAHPQQPQPRRTAPEHQQSSPDATFARAHHDDLRKALSPCVDQPFRSMHDMWDRVFPFHTLATPTVPKAAAQKAAQEKESDQIKSLREVAAGLFVEYDRLQERSNVRNRSLVEQVLLERLSLPTDSSQSLGQLKLEPAP